MNTGGEVGDYEMAGREALGNAAAGNPVDVRQSDRARVVKQNRPRRVILWTALAVGVVVAGLVGVLATRKGITTRLVDSPLIGQQAPPVSGQSVLDADTGDSIATGGDSSGDAVSLDQYAGKWVLLNFFASWCVPCREEHPALQAFEAQHRPAGDAAVVGVVYSDGQSAVRAWFDDNGGSWPVVDDPEGRVALDYGVRGVPESFLIDPDGVVVAKITGGVRAEELETLLARAKAGEGRQ
jgi:cytochrome c biogenesis protein CcmG/thiol:disulfide interchange protein DsbE